MAALFATLGSTTSQPLNLFLFDKLRNALVSDVRLLLGYKGDRQSAGESAARRWLGGRVGTARWPRGRSHVASRGSGSELARIAPFWLAPRGGDASCSHRL